MTQRMMERAKKVIITIKIKQVKKLTRSSRCTFGYCLSYQEGG